MNNINKEFIQNFSKDLSILNKANILCQNKSFSNYKKTKDDKIFFAKCSENSKTYNVSIDFTIPKNPIFRCNCYSRQIPCKHTIALFQEISSGVYFEIDETVNNLGSKVSNRNKFVSKNLSKKQIKIHSNRIKIMKKQLKGLSLVEKFISEMLDDGILKIVIKSTKDYYLNLANELDNLYITEVQHKIYEFIGSVINLQKQPYEEESYIKAMTHLLQLNEFTKQTKKYLTQAIIDDNISVNHDYFEDLEKPWNTKQIKSFYETQDNVKLVQIGFYIVRYEFAREFVDVSYFYNLENGKILVNYNKRPIKLDKYPQIKDINFNIIEPEPLFYYPKSTIQKITFEKFKSQEITKDTISIINSFGFDINFALKKAKKYLKNTLSKKGFPALISYEKIGINDLGMLILLDKKGEKIKIYNDDKIDNKLDIKVNNLKFLPSSNLYRNQCLFGEIYYDGDKNCFAMLPLSVISEDKIIFL